MLVPYIFLLIYQCLDRQNHRQKRQSGKRFPPMGKQAASGFCLIAAHAENSNGSYVTTTAPLSTRSQILPRNRPSGNSQSTTHSFDKHSH